MTDRDPKPVTRLLGEAAAGREEAMGELIPLIYEELRTIARRQRYRHRPFETLHTTALVNEAFLKLAGREGATWENRVHFLRAASRAMRDVLVDYARRQRAGKRGGGQSDQPLDDALDLPDLPDVKADEVLEIHDALTRLEAQDARQARIVELRYFTGLNVPETAEVLGISPITVKREWAVAKAWLRRLLDGDGA